MTSVMRCQCSGGSLLARVNHAACFALRTHGATLVVDKNIADYNCTSYIYVTAPSHFCRSLPAVGFGPSVLDQPLAVVIQYLRKGSMKAQVKKADLAVCPALPESLGASNNAVLHHFLISC